MKQIIRLATPFALAFMLTACGGNNEQHDQGMMKDGEMMHDQEMMENQRRDAQSITIKDDKLNAVYQHYVHLTNALVNSDVAEAKSAANAIETGAKELEGGTAIASSAAKISGTSTLEEQREAYIKLSSEMEDQVKKAGLTSGEVYVQFCPMANNDKGATWLSSTQEVRNPYMGEKMLKCGENKETIQ